MLLWSSLPNTVPSSFPPNVYGVQRLWRLRVSSSATLVSDVVTFDTLAPRPDCDAVVLLFVIGAMGKVMYLVFTMLRMFYVLTEALNPCSHNPAAFYCVNCEDSHHRRVAYHRQPIMVRNVVKHSSNSTTVSLDKAALGEMTLSQHQMKKCFEPYGASGNRARNACKHNFWLSSYRERLDIHHGHLQLPRPVMQVRCCYYNCRAYVLY